MSAQKTNHKRLWGVLLLAGVILIAWFATPMTLKFGENIKELPTMFGYLILISLFVERAIEVFLSAWRSAGADELDIKLANIRKRITDSAKTSEDQHPDTSPDRTGIRQLKDELESLEKERSRYRSDSRYISYWLGLGIGFLVALVGVRVLGNIMDINTLTGLQAGIFVIVDILLTGAVLAGGSDAINKIMKLYNSLMALASAKTKVIE